MGDKIHSRKGVMLIWSYEDASAVFQSYSHVSTEFPFCVSLDKFFPVVSCGGRLEIQRVNFTLNRLQFWKTLTWSDLIELRLPKPGRSLRTGFPPQLHYIESELGKDLFIANMDRNKHSKKNYINVHMGRWVLFSDCFKMYEPSLLSTDMAPEYCSKLSAIILLV